MGSIDFLTEFSTIDNPFLLYHPDNQQFTNDYKTNTDGILYDSIENMPTQFPTDSSYSFGKNLYPLIEGILKSDFSLPLEKQGLPLSVEKAVITDKGQLTDRYSYIQKLRLVKQEQKNLCDIKLFRKQSTIGWWMLKLRGHLFDTKAINKILDMLIDHNQCNTAVSNWIVGNGSNQHSECIITLKAVKDIDVIKKEVSRICQELDIEFSLEYKDQNDGELVDN